MRSDTKPANEQNEPLEFFLTDQALLSSCLSATTRDQSMTQLMHSKQPSTVSKHSKTRLHLIALSKSMEKTFQRMMNKPALRNAYVEAEIRTSVAHQIRAIRTSRGLTQSGLAKQMGTTQAAISRIEDPSYGKLTLQTLFDLSRVFDTGLRVEFVSMISMLNKTYKPRLSSRNIPSFSDEAPLVCFYSVQNDLPAPVHMVASHNFHTSNNNSYKAIDLIAVDTQLVKFNNKNIECVQG